MRIVRLGYYRLIQFRSDKERQQNKAMPCLFLDVAPPFIVQGQENSSGPLLDRIDISVEVPAAQYKELASKTLGTSSKNIRDQLEIVRMAQRERFTDLRVLYSSQMSSKQLTDDCIAAMKQSVNEKGLSACAHDKVLCVARTIADIESSINIELHHLAEAINYRQLDRQIWS